MLALIQRVKQASVTVSGKQIAAIDQGLCLLLGIHQLDTQHDIDFIISKLEKIKFFADAGGKFALTLNQIQGSLLVVPQFTLCGTLNKGTKPEFSKSMSADKAALLFEQFCDQLAQKGYTVAIGKFKAYMDVSIHNDGPVTFIIDTQNKHEDST